jgi:hypothetical protein
MERLEFYGVLRRYSINKNKLRRTVSVPVWCIDVDERKCLVIDELGKCIQVEELDVDSVDHVQVVVPELEVVRVHGVKSIVQDGEVTEDPSFERGRSLRPTPRWRVLP